MTQNHVIRLLFSLLLIPIGAVLILLEVDGKGGELLSKLGLAFTVAGIASSFHEGILRRLEGRETARKVADEVQSRLEAAPLSATGIRLLSPVRKGYAGYYLWAVDNGPEELFFAGRSVLHRIDADFRSRSLGGAESVFARRIAEGANVKILFVDPRSDIIPRLAREEGQEPEELLSDVATSIGVCVRLFAELRNRELPPGSSLDVLVFDQIPYFSYHSVGDNVIVGFYFSSTLGYSSAAFEVVDIQTKEFFAEHFRSIFSRAADRYILRTSPHSGAIELNRALIDDLKKPISEAIGDEAARHLMDDELRARLAG